MIPSMFDRPSGAGALLTPFDSFTPTAGYSLRYLSIDYFGQPVVEVRKDVAGNPTQDFTPNQLTDGTLASFADGNDCFVSKWYDQFGSNDATNSTAAEQPKIWDASTGLVTENGKPAIKFDGVDDIMSFSSISTPMTVFIVNAAAQDANDDILISNGFGGSGIHLGFNDGLYFRDYPAESVGYTTGLSANQQNLAYAKITIGDRDYYINSNLVGSNTATDATNYFAISVDTAQGLRGTIQEIIIYNTDQSANRTKIEDNINDYYDIY